jgi:hypothetical protein
LGTLRDRVRNFTLSPTDTVTDENHDTEGFSLTLNLNKADDHHCHVPFGHALAAVDPGFAVLTRYYVLNLYTGAHHLYRFNILGTEIPT